MTDKALAKIASKARAVLEGLPTHLEEDRAALAEAEAEAEAEGYEGRRLAALRYRIEVKTLLSAWAGDTLAASVRPFLATSTSVWSAFSV